MQTKTIQILLSNACLSFCSTFVLMQSNAFSMDENAYYVQHHSEHHRKGKLRHRYVYVEDNSLAYKLNRSAGRLVAAVLYTPIDALNMVAHITGHVLNPHQEQIVHTHMHHHHRHHKHGKHRYHFTAEEYTEPEHHATHKVPLKDLNIRHETYTGQDIEALGHQNSLLSGVLLAPKMVLGMLGFHQCCQMHCHVIHVHKHKTGHHKHGIKKHHHHIHKDHHHKIGHHHHIAKHYHHALKNEPVVYEKPIHHTPVKKDVSGEHNVQATPKIEEPNQVIKQPVNSNPPPSYPTQPIMKQNQTLQPETPQTNKISDPLQPMLDKKNSIPVNNPIIEEKPAIQQTNQRLNKPLLVKGQSNQVTHQVKKDDIKATKISKESLQKQQAELYKHNIVASQHGEIAKVSKAIEPVSNKKQELKTAPDRISGYLDTIWLIKDKISLANEAEVVKKAIPKQQSAIKHTASIIKSTNHFKMASNFYEYKAVQHQTFVPYQIEMAKINYVETRPMVVIKSLGEVNNTTNENLRTKFEAAKSEQQRSVSMLIGQSIKSSHLINTWIFTNLGSDLSRKNIQLTSEDSQLKPKKDQDELKKSKHISSWF